MKYVNMFRYINGVKTKVRFTLDDDNVIVDELPIPDPANAQQAELKKRGYEFHVSPEGTLIIDKIPARESKILSFFQPENPCWFPGCEELRAAYLAELEKIGGPDCPDCIRGDLIRKYQEIIRSRWDGDV